MVTDGVNDTMPLIEIIITAPAVPQVNQPPQFAQNAYFFELSEVSSSLDVVGSLNITDEGLSPSNHLCGC